MKVFFDENFSQYIAHAINSLEFTTNQIQVIATYDILSGESDRVIAEYVASQNGVLFSKDKDFKKVQFLVELMDTFRIGLFYMKTQKKEDYWRLCDVIIKAYINKCRDIILSNKRPYYYEIMGNGSLKHRPL